MTRRTSKVRKVVPCEDETSRRMPVRMRHWGSASHEGRGPTGAVDGIVIDRHPQQRAVVDFQRLVLDSLRSALAGTVTKVFVVSYSDHVQLIQDWSTGDSGLQAAAAFIAADGNPQHSRGTVLNDGMMDAVTRLGASPAGALRRLIALPVLLSWSQTIGRTSAECDNSASTSTAWLTRLEDARTRCGRTGRRWSGRWKTCNHGCPSSAT